MSTLCIYFLFIAVQITQADTLILSRRMCEHHFGLITKMMMSTYKNNSIRSIDEQRQKALEIAET